MSLESSMRVVALLLCGLVLMFGAMQTAKAQDKVPVEDFFRKSKFTAVSLSPNGKHLAFVAASPSGEDRNVLATAAVEAPQKWTVVAKLLNADVASFSWVNNARLVFDVEDRQSPMGQQSGEGLYAVNVDGSEFVWLIAHKYGDHTSDMPSWRPLLHNHVYTRSIRDGSDDVLGILFERLRYSGEATLSRPIRINTKTKGVKVIEDDSPKGSRGWIVNRAATKALFVSTSLDGRNRLLYRKDGKWETLTDYESFVSDSNEVLKVEFADAKGQLYVSAERNDAMRTRALYRFDLEKRQREPEPTFAVKGYDYTGSPVFDGDDQSLLGVRYTSDAVGMEWFHPAMKAVQVEVDRLLPNTNNLINCTKCLQATHMVVSAYSDRQPLVYFLYDLAAKKLTLIGASRPWIDAKQMASQDLVSVRTRDGLDMPVYVTKPQGKGPWPTVTLVHGGPFMRGVYWGWASASQFLASRGYLVLEPEFRGSMGYGTAYTVKGFKQWGLAMQDDLTDATQWAVKSGLADPKRLVIAGASYGGYATMMGLVKEPDLYRAGINWVGLTDIDLWYDIGWSDLSDEWKSYGMPKMIGDQKTDRAQLDATSPLKQAHRITKPVLMAYGTDDKRVPLPHGEKMRDALNRSGKAPVEWVTYRDEGHNWMLEATHVDFWKRVEAFLAKHAN